MRDNTRFIWGAVMGAWLHVPTAVMFLLGFMALDVATGLIASYVNKELASDISHRGLARKVLVVLLVGAAHLLVKAVPGIFGPWSIGGVELSLGSAVATAYTMNEVISILENCARAKVPVPSVLVQALAKVKTQVATPEEIKALRGRDNAEA